MQVFEPRPLKGGCRWTASPRQKTLPFEYSSATISLMDHLEIPRISADIESSPIKFLTWRRYSSFVGSGLSTPGLGIRINIHSCQGLTIRTTPIQPKSHCSRSGCMTQCRLPFLGLTKWDRSAFTRTLNATPPPG